MCSLSAVQDLSKWLQYLLAKIAVGELFPKKESVDEDGAADAQNLSDHHFWASHRMPRSYYDFFC
jgi:hypothetical protein